MIEIHDYGVSGDIRTAAASLPCLHNSTVVSRMHFDIASCVSGTLRLCHDKICKEPGMDITEPCI